MIDLNEKRVVKTLDVSEVSDYYEVWLYGVFYGENKDRVGMIGASTWSGSRLGMQDESMTFISINDDFEVGSAWIIDVGDFFMADILDIYANEEYLQILCRAWYWYWYESEYIDGRYFSNRDIIDFKVSHEQLM